MSDRSFTAPGQSAEVGELTVMCVSLNPVILDIPGRGRTEVQDKESVIIDGYRVQVNVFVHQPPTPKKSRSKKAAEAPAPQPRTEIVLRVPRFQTAPRTPALALAMS